MSQDDVIKYLIIIKIIIIITLITMYLKEGLERPM